jgi:predicted  nucleic acid-binding Zn ribbon protein
MTITDHVATSKRQMQKEIARLYQALMIRGRFALNRAEYRETRKAIRYYLETIRGRDLWWRCPSSDWSPSGYCIDWDMLPKNKIILDF